MSRTNNHDSRSKQGSGKHPNGKKGIDQSPTNNKLEGKDNKSKAKNRAGLDSKGYPNDVNYYFFSPELAQQASQLSFQNVLGLGQLDGYEVPSIMAIHFNPSFGNTYPTVGVGPRSETTPTESALPEVPTGRSAINAMGDKLYTLMSQFTGRTANYGPQDITEMIGAIASLAEATEHVRRAFGVILTYNERNRAIPNLLIQAMGIDYADMAANFSNYRMRFNTAIARINQIPLLDNVMYITKAREMYQKVFTDSPSPMAQIFLYVPHTVWILDESSYTEGTILKTTDFVKTRSAEKLSTYLTIIEQMITALVESSTLNMVYADLLNMANKLNVPLWHFDYLAENYVVMPEYSPGAILQWHNIDVVGEPLVTENFTKSGFTFTNSNDVYPDVNNNGILYNPRFAYDNDRAVTVVDSPIGVPDVTDRIEALRMSSCNGNWTLVTSGSPVSVFKALSDHYVTRLEVFTNLHSTSTLFSSENVTITNAALLSQFENGPLMQHSNRVFGSLSYYTEVPYEYLKRVNELMMMGLLDFRV